MPWEARDALSLREEFVLLAQQPDRNMAQLCERFGIARKTGYKWLARQASAGTLQERSRRPQSSPAKTPAEIEAEVVALRRQHPAWGGRKLHRVLTEHEGLEGVPAISTITGILHRHGLIVEAESQKHAPFIRFERAEPNELWQMDFKGHFATDRERCHPLTILDDHSRYAVGLFACNNEQTETVKNHLTQVFLRYGMPQAILCDNGPPWGTAGAEERHTVLTVWLMQVGVRVLHGRPCHPQTQGKDERFHRTLVNEVLYERFRDCGHSQTRFDGWRQVYNWKRPHEALGLDVPGQRYKPSAREFPKTLPQAEYEAGQLVRKVDCDGYVSLWNKSWKIGKAFAGQRVLIEPSGQDGVWNVRFHGLLVKTLDQRSNP
jgi:transposase InsO family protein